MSPVFFLSQAEFRKWLGKHHGTESEIWVGFYNQRAPKQHITYRQALDEALCFGWIDGIRKSVDPVSYMIRFTPRKPKSKWSAVNIKRAKELVAMGLVEPHGLEAFAKCDEGQSRKYSYEERPKNLEEKYARQLRANKSAWKFFQEQPPSYQRTASFWVMSAAQEETRLRRLAVLIADSANGVRIAPLRRTKPGR